VGSKKGGNHQKKYTSEKEGNSKLLYRKGDFCTFREGEGPLGWFKRGRIRGKGYYTE